MKDGTKFYKGMLCTYLSSNSSILRPKYPILNLRLLGQIIYSGTIDDKSWIILWGVDTCYFLQYSAGLTHITFPMYTDIWTHRAVVRSHPSTGSETGCCLLSDIPMRTCDYLMYGYKEQILAFSDTRDFHLMTFLILSWWLMFQCISALVKCESKLIIHRV